MFKKLFLTTALGAYGLTPLLAQAAATSMAKDEWLDKVKELVPQMICKNFTENENLNKQLKAANIDYDKCVSLIPASFDKCKTKFYNDIPSSIDNAGAEKWGGSLGECIGTDFAVQYLVGNSTKESTSSESNASSTSSSSTMSKDEWLGKMKAAVPDLICKGFLNDESLSKQLKDKDIDYSKCVSLIPTSVDKCQTELYSNIPSTIDDAAASKWGHSLGECIGKDFALKNLL